MSPPLFSISIWCPFCSIHSMAMAAMVSEGCLYSLETLEFGSIPGVTRFALTECEHTTDWRWAIISPNGLIIEDGRAPTREQAQSIAESKLMETGFDPARAGQPSQRN